MRLTAILAGFTLALASGAHAGSVPKYDDTMPLSQVKPGMKGYGLTVFRGTTIEKFEVTVVGVVKKGSLVVAGADMILVKMSGGPITTRGAYLIKGMSGSPVYINGKIIGAFSQGEPTAKESLGGVTPIDDMLEAWDPKLPDKPLSRFPESRIQYAQLSQPLKVGTRTVRRVIWNAPMDAAVRGDADTLVMHPCTTVMAVTGGSKYGREKLAAALAPYNVELVQGQGGGAMPEFKGAPLVPGAAFSMLLCTGDFSFPATGTVSYRKGDRILGFGHPFLGIGAIEAPLTSAWVHDIYPLTAGSYKISSPGPVVGASSQDRNFSVSGTLGKMPKTIPVTVTVSDVTTGRSRTFKSQAVNHPNLTGAIISMAVGSGIVEVRNTPGPAVAKVETTVEAEELGKISRSNLCFDTRGIDAAATADLDEMLGICLSNPFYPVTVKSATVKVEISSGRPTASVERIFLKEGKFAPGETVEVGVVLKPYKQPSVTRLVKLTIPHNAQTGRYMVTVRGGAIPMGFGGLIARGQGAEQAPPVNTKQMVQRLLDREKNNEFTARLVLPTTTVSVEGEKMSGLPPSLDMALRSAKNSGVKLERDEVKAVVSTEFYVGGQQALLVNVQRKEVSDSPGQSGGGFPGGGPSGERGSGINPALLAGGDFSVTGGLLDPDEIDRALRAFSVSPTANLLTDDKKPESGKIAPKGKDPQAKPGDKPASPGTGPGAVPIPQVPAGPETPVGRTSQTWIQRTKADFEKGEGKGVAVNSRGNITVTRRLVRMANTGESILWCVIGDGKDGFYAGSGPRGAVLHIGPRGAFKTVTTLPEISVHCLTRTSDGTLYAGTGPSGRVYRISSDGKAELALQTDQKYVLGLASDAKGQVYAACGGERGRLYRLNSKGGEVLFSAAEEHLQSIVCMPDGAVVVGAAANGTIYRIVPGKEPSVLYDAPDPSITALAVSPNGDVLAGTGPRGTVLRIHPDGTAKPAIERLSAPVSSITVGKDGNAWVSSGSSVLFLNSEDVATPMDCNGEVEYLGVTAMADGRVTAVTGNIGEVYMAESGNAEAGEYTSTVLDAKSVSQWGNLRINSNAISSNQASVETRTGNVAEPDATWSSWAPIRTMTTGSQVLSPAARFFQYRIHLSGPTTSVRAVSVSYLPRNMAPKVAFSAPLGLERWSKSQTLKWEASDPDRDVLTYEVYMSSDDGKTWQPLPSGTTTTVSVGAAAIPNLPGVSLPARPKPPTMEEVEAELAKAGNVPPALREAILSRAKQVNAEFAAQGSKGATPGAASAPTASRETNRTLDTTRLKDGIYRFKVVASDRIGNPQAPLTATAISEPVVICNKAPALYLVKASILVGADRSVHIDGAALQTFVTIAAVQYRVDGGDWFAAAPNDGIYDGETEAFTLDTLPLTPGSHKIEVKAFSSAGVTSTETITVEVK